MTSLKDLLLWAKELSEGKIASLHYTTVLPEKHVGDNKLPTELSKTSQPMTWNQPSKKEILSARAQDTTFVKPAHSDVTPTQEDTVSISWSNFDPRPPMHCTLNTEAVKGLLSQVQASIPHTGLSQFWGKTPNYLGLTIAVVHQSCGPLSYSHMRMWHLCHQICSISLLLSNALNTCEAGHCRRVMW